MFNLKFRTLLALGFLAVVVMAQGDSGIDGLPECATTCAQTAALAAQCSIQPLDLICLCSSGFTAATITCSVHDCSIGEQRVVSNLLGRLCGTLASSTLVPTNTSTPESISSAASTLFPSSSASLIPLPSPSRSSALSVTTVSSFVPSTQTASITFISLTTLSGSTVLITPSSSASLNVSGPGPVIPNSTVSFTSGFSVPLSSSAGTTVVVLSTSMVPLPSSTVASAAGTVAVGEGLLLGVVLGLVVIWVL